LHGDVKQEVTEDIKALRISGKQVVLWRTKKVSKLR